MWQLFLFLDGSPLLCFPREPFSSPRFFLSCGLLQQVDRALLELHLPPEEMYQSFARAIESVNVIIATYNDELLGDVQVRISWISAAPLLSFCPCKVGFLRM